MLAMCPSKLPSRLVKLLSATVLTGMSTSLALAAGDPPLPTPLDQAAFTISSHADLTIRPDRTVRKVIDLRITLQKEAAIRAVGQQQLSYIEGMETLTILEAYTQKQDGRRIDVDPSQIITTDLGSGVNFSFLRDQKVRTTIFPDLSVGDTIVLKAAIDKSQDFFPGHFSDQFVFPRVAPFKDATLTVTIPKEVAVKVQVTGDDVSQTVAEDDAVRRRVITYTSRGTLTDPPGALSFWDREPHILISSLSDHAELGRAYWSAAAPKAVVTPQIQAVADQVTSGLSDRRAQAEALDLWVKRNIRYVAVYIGAGRWQPHPADDVLKNRYGDCKDHAILLAALLAAKGIGSEQVLINLGNAYVLPEVAAKAPFNHAIIYIPELDLYDDPTASHAAFGVLHEQAYDKPVVHGGPAGGRLARTPVMRADDHTSTNRTTINVAADGAVSGETVQIGTGVFATGLRSTATRHQADPGAAASILKSIGVTGVARMTAPSPSDFSEPYALKVAFSYDKKWTLPLAGQRDIPLGAPVQKRPGEFLLNTRLDNRRTTFQCYSGRQIEEVSVTFAEGLPLPQKINGRTVSNRLITYVSSYRQEGRTFIVRREFAAHVPGQVCAPEMENEIAEAIKDVRASMRTRLTFKSAPVSQSKESERDASLAGKGVAAEN
jgi:transglutaminase-like putative cysteine protease